VKKAIALSFLLLANIIILAHAAVPHYHHNQIPVALNVFHHEHNDATHGHHHHHHPDDTAPVEHNENAHSHAQIEDCLLEKTFTRIGSDRQSLQTLDWDFSQFPCLFSILTSNSIPEIYDDIGLAFSQKPYTLSHHTNYITQSLGLRAPPVC